MFPNLFQVGYQVVSFWFFPICEEIQPYHPNPRIKFILAVIYSFLAVWTARKESQLNKTII